MEPRAGTDVLRGRLLDGRYRIGSRIARGGMASVYEALDERLDRTVAVKIMHAGLSDSDSDRDFAQRFVSEARAAARLTHPNVVAVYDQGRHQGLPYLVMEYVQGNTLRDLLTQRRRLNPVEACAILEQMLAVRIHLDPCGLNNGPVRVIDGSHRLGRLSPEAIDRLRASHPVTDCVVESGGILAFRPLILHASAPATVVLRIAWAAT